jgi:hypothetical protein
MQRKLILLSILVVAGLVVYLILHVIVWNIHRNRVCKLLPISLADTARCDSSGFLRSFLRVPVIAAFDHTSPMLGPSHGFALGDLDYYFLHLIISSDNSKDNAAMLTSVTSQVCSAGWRPWNPATGGYMPKGCTAEMKYGMGVKDPVLHLEYFSPDFEARHGYVICLETYKTARRECLRIYGRRFNTIEY